MENKNWMNHRGWFYAFIFLILLILIAMIYITVSVSDDTPPLKHEKEMDNKDFTIAFNNHELQTLMNSTLKDYDIKTHIKNKTVSFDTKTKILGKQLDVTINTHPKKYDRSTIKFNIKSIDIGKLNISNPFILSQIKNHGDIPPYIQIHPKDESFYLSLDELDIQNVDNIQIQTLDLLAKKWYFDIKLK
ncbi:DUF2140 family protein [Mammaliicoccus sp. Dog046]|uniref:DUF2140 family protein n=1 Tax=Mammaliicoccus sp. Dog046 TaxID=3034233 RepID=UPI002B25C0FA|nr:DUF2140 family protein [Mammaliicoccus sp. Dog046]WQK84360.1 DUF2140 family protein [Mammaliicoccus sp. Dog046]